PPTLRRSRVSSTCDSRASPQRRTHPGGGRESRSSSGGGATPTSYLERRIHPNEEVTPLWISSPYPGGRAMRQPPAMRMTPGVTPGQGGRGVAGVASRARGSGGLSIGPAATISRFHHGGRREDPPVDRPPRGRQEADRRPAGRGRYGDRPPQGARAEEGHP